MTDHTSANQPDDTDVQRAILAELRQQRELLQDVATNMRRIRAITLTAFWLFVLFTGLPFLLRLMSL